MRLKTASGKSKILSVGVIGTALEYYDYTLYGFLIPIFAKIFFPNEDPELSLYYAFGVFTAGFVMRPLGSMIWGYVADAHGRHRVLTQSVLLMSASTFIICILPTYSQIGIFSPLLLILCRLVQGFSIGGEFIASFVFTLEHTKPSRKGFVGSIIDSGQKLGFVLGTIASYIIIQNENPEWVWRYAFFIGSLLGLVGLFIRRHLEETPEFKRLNHQASAPLNHFKEAYKTNIKNIYALSGLNVGLTGTIYTIFVYMHIFFNEKLNWDLKNITRYSFYAQVICIAMILISGYLSDKINKKLIMIGFLVVGFLGVLPIYKLSLSGETTSIIVFYMFVGFVWGGYTGPWCALHNASFPTTHRLSGISLGFSLPQALAGGLTPIILKATVNYTGNLFMPVYFVMVFWALAIISLLTIYSRKETVQSV